MTPKARERLLRSLSPIRGQIEDMEGHINWREGVQEEEREKLKKLKEEFYEICHECDISPDDVPEPNYYHA